MKKIIYRLIFISTLFSFIMLGFVSNSCSKDESASVDSISTDNVDALQKVITIPDGSLVSGTLPNSSSNANSPNIDSYQSSVSTASGYQLLIPIHFTSNNGWKYIYLQISGATNGFFKITNTGTSTNSGTIAIPINIPGQVLNGNFDIEYSIVDNNNLVSSYIITSIVIKNALTCNDAYNYGSEGLTFTQVNLGNQSGTASLEYDTYSVPDRIDIYQGQTWLGGTGSNPGTLVPPLCDCDTPLAGFIGASGTISFNYNPSKGQVITIVVSGCMGGGTAWEWYLNCPE